MVSWSGSMFEYLMPLLVMPTFPRTLLDQTYDVVVDRQIDYGERLGVPWGVSESCYSVTDADGNYQYRAFGVPGLGLQRGLSNDIVIAPVRIDDGVDGESNRGVPKSAADGG